LTQTTFSLEFVSNIQTKKLQHCALSTTVLNAAIVVFLNISSRHSWFQRSHLQPRTSNWKQRFKLIQNSYANKVTLPMQSNREWKKLK